ncbi:unnamed protein product, partial [marine sediment metagenome]
EWVWGDIVEPWNCETRVEQIAIENTGPLPECPGETVAVFSQGVAIEGAAYAGPFGAASSGGGKYSASILLADKPTLLEGISLRPDVGYTCTRPMYGSALVNGLPKGWQLLLGGPGGPSFSAGEFVLIPPAQSDSLLSIDVEAFKESVASGGHPTSVNLAAPPSWLATLSIGDFLCDPSSGCDPAFSLSEGEMYYYGAGIKQEMTVVQPPVGAHYSIWTGGQDGRTSVLSAFAYRTLAGVEILHAGILTPPGSSQLGPWPSDYVVKGATQV